MMSLGSVLIVGGLLGRWWMGRLLRRWHDGDPRLGLAKELEDGRGRRDLGFIGHTDQRIMYLLAPVFVAIGIALMAGGVLWQ